MKELNVMGKILNFAKQPIKSTDGSDLLIKNIIVQYLATYAGKDGKKVMRARSLGQRMYDLKKDPITMDDADLDLIIEAMKEPQHTAIALGPVYEALEAAK